MISSPHVEKGNPVTLEDFDEIVRGIFKTEMTALVTDISATIKSLIRSEMKSLETFVVVFHNSRIRRLSPAASISNRNY